MADELFTLLDRYGFQALQTMCGFQKIAETGRSKKDVFLRKLQDLFSQPERAKKAFDMLPEAGKALILFIQRQGGRAGFPAILSNLLELALVDAPDERSISRDPGNYKNANTRVLPDLLAHLQVSGLIFATKNNNLWDADNTLTLKVAREYVLAPALLKALPPPPGIVLPERAQPPRVLESSARVFQRDLYLYWTYVARNRPDLIASGRLAKRQLTALNETLLQRESITTGQSEADFPRLVFLRNMLEAMNLIMVADRNLVALPGEGFFSLAPLERIQRCFEAYVTARTINELAELDQITAMRYMPLLPAPDLLLNARRALGLQYRVGQRWAALADLVKHVRNTHYEFLLSRSFSPSRGYGYYSYSSSVSPYSSYGNEVGWEWNLPFHTDADESWERVEGRFIAYTVTGPLFWMGLAELGISDPRGEGTEADYFHLTAPGAWLFAGAPAPEIAVEGGQVVVQPDFTILAFDPVSDGVLLTLERFAQRVSAERAILFRMTQASAYTAQQQGWSAARIQKTLEELTHQPLPANVARTLEEWQANHERIRIFPHANLLYTSRPEDIAEMRQNKEVETLLQEEKMPGLVLLPLKIKVNDARHTLAKAGWQVSVIKRQNQLPAQSVQFTEDGQMTIVQRSAGIYLRAHLARFAEAEGEKFRITPASLRRAIAAGMTAQQVLAELGSVASAPLPRSLEQRILAWGGHFGTAQIQPGLLLRFARTDVLKELLLDPEIARLLQPVRASDVDKSAWASPKDVETLRRLLQERGVEIKE